jgi:hypothetical protein
MDRPEDRTVPAQQLTLKERAVLLGLLTEARALTNTELYAAAGVKLDGASRVKLNDLKLVTSVKEGRGFVHELTDAGGRWCEEELVAERPERSGSGGGALYAVLGGLQRYLQRTGQRLVDIFQPVDQSADDAGEPDLETRIRTAYTRLTKEPGESWLALRVLRTDLADVPREDLDHALQQLSREPGVHVQAEANQQSLTEEDHQAAVRFGGSSRHALKIENL